MDFSQGPSIGAVIRGKRPATCMSYHEDGSYLFITSEEDSRLRIVDCLRGTSDKPAFKFERDGVKLVQSTHHNQSLIFTGSQKDKAQNVGSKFALNYLSVHDNKILRQFRGHSGEVTNISMSPVDDTFLTSSKDRTIRLWDLKQAGSIAAMDMPKQGNGFTMSQSSFPIAAFDSTGLVFGITAPTETGNVIHLYDARKYTDGAFSEMNLDSQTLASAIEKRGMPASISAANWTSMTFNQSGKQILVTTDEGMMIVVDGYDANIVTNVFFSEGETNNMGSSTACFSSDDNAVLVANGDGTIDCYDTMNGTLLKKLKGHVGAIGCVASNPKYSQIASACTNIAIWNW